MSTLYNHHSQKVGRPSSVEGFFNGGSVEVGIAIYSCGIVTKRNAKIVAKSGGGKRGVVKGWSSASRRRMREFMMKKSPPDGFVTVSMTCTIPGPNQGYFEAKRFWDHFCKNFVVRNGWCMIWRAELQKRGQMHWHCILSVPPDEKNIDARACYEVSAAVWSALDVLKLPQDYDCKHWDTPHEPITLTKGSPVMWVPGANERSVKCGVDDGHSSWYRYMLDHASKAKQVQYFNGGRCWGVVGRKLYQDAVPLFTSALSDDEMKKLVRMMQRMFRPRRNNADPFGWKHGYRAKRGGRGEACWFSEESKKVAVRRYAESLISERQAVFDFPEWKKKLEAKRSADGTTTPTGGHKRDDGAQLRVNKK